MSVALIWGAPGSGKTVAATAPAKEKILLLCSDNSSVVLNMFDRPNVTVERVEHWLQQEEGDSNYFSAQFEAALVSGKYTLIVVDNLTDIKELALQEIEDGGKIKDIRQIYQAVYMALKRLTRMAAKAIRERPAHVSPRSKINYVGMETGQLSRRNASGNYLPGI